ncbi:NAD(P)/FAD-dependent oxidoreductase [Arthrobacter sp. W4I7]|uniref:flavin-containing monooxygenase n=1 Tax=Arthrobacter sp. W4I7 TaxID=3042296 RepID=UPI00277FF30D|nr:NAD(P)/FAD-dependent oxidoreductase [Arthrobacter sp. W4I7]MDQ0691424.1 cyclohexanone monooxygenase [Arthrobacter sp. W4I7]
MMTPYAKSAEPTTISTADVVVVGAGFAGLYALRRFRDDLGMRVRAFEKGNDVGGTWYWNQYPGARCDVPSTFYSYSWDEALEQEWTWTEKYATQPEILAYLQHAAGRFDLYKDIDFSTAVTGARYDEERNRWVVTTDKGETVEAQFVVTAVGCLSASNLPGVPGLDDFVGDIYHTGEWPREGVDFTGKRVVVIGTGSSGLQVIPQIALQAEHLTVLQRTPSFSVPAWNRPFTEEEITEIKANYRKLREAARATAGGVPAPPSEGKGSELSAEEFNAALAKGWEAGGASILRTFDDLMVDENTNEAVAEFFRARIREIVDDPKTAELLCPSGFPVGAKRLCVDTDYFATYNRYNVELVSVKDSPIELITATGIRAGGRDIEADAIVFATGYDAMTGPYLKMDIRGRGGLTLQEKWEAGPRTYLGIATAKYPNLFMITAPGSPSVLGNVVAAIEQHVEWITDYLNYLRDHDIPVTEPTMEAEDEWVDHVNALADATIYTKAASWYLGANIPGKPRVFMPYPGGHVTYRKKCDQVAADDYEGFSHQNSEVLVGSLA